MRSGSERAPVPHAFACFPAWQNKRGAALSSCPLPGPHPWPPAMSGLQLRTAPRDCLVANVRCRPTLRSAGTAVDVAAGAERTTEAFVVIVATAIAGSFAGCDTPILETIVGPAGVHDGGVEAFEAGFVRRRIAVEDAAAGLHGFFRPAKNFCFASSKVGLAATPGCLGPRLERAGTMLRRHVIDGCGALSRCGK